MRRKYYRMVRAKVLENHYTRGPALSISLTRKFWKFYL